MQTKQCRPCPQCQSSCSTPLASITAEQIIESSPYYPSTSYAHLNVDRGDLFEVSRCTECDFVFSSAVPSEEFLTNLYRTGNLAESIRSFARPDRSAYAFASLAKLLSAIAQQNNDGRDASSQTHIKILDVGCAYGVGSLGLTHTDYPYSVTGVEPCAETRAYLDSQGMNSTYAAVAEIPSEARFDGILLNDVLEHVPAPLEFLQELKRVSHSNTLFWVNVPNFIEWRLADILSLVKKGQNNIPTDFNPWEHLSYFSPASLDSTMLTIGASRVQSDLVNYPMDTSSSLQLLKSVLKLIRDLPKLKARAFPSGHTTAGLFKYSDSVKG